MMRGVGSASGSFRIVAVVIAITGLNLLVLMIYQYTLTPRPAVFEFAGNMSIAVFAPHQDDDVIMAGGLLQKNPMGLNYIIFLTKPEKEKIADIRRADAIAAWFDLSGVKPSFYFLDFVSDRNSWNANKYAQALAEIKALLTELQPNIVIVPLVEGGHSEHDLTNKLVRQALRELELKADLWQAALYNPYYLAAESPAKLLWFLVRLAPFVPYKEPNYGLHPTAQRVLNMSQEEMNIKIAMLKRFSTEANVIPVEQFGYPDLFDETSSLPKIAVRIGEKRFDAWAFATLVLVAASLVLIGYSAAYRVGQFYAGAITMLLLTPPAWLILIHHSRALIENWIYPTILGLGFLSRYCIAFFTQLYISKASQGGSR